LFLAIFALGVYILYILTKGEGGQNGNVEENIESTYNDPEIGILFKYNKTFPYKYINALEWPPRVDVKDEAFVCTEKEGEAATTTVEKLSINNRIYCLTTIPGGAAAGTYYESYEYRFSEDGKVVGFFLTLGFATCQNYSEPYAGECQSERESFDVNKLIDQIRNTVKFSNPTNISTTGISGSVSLGPTCPLEMMDSPNPECADKPYRANLVLITSEWGRIVKNFSSDAEGKFAISVSPGEYVIRSEIPNTLPYCTTDPFQVLTGTTTVALVHCDSGIR